MHWEGAWAESPAPSIRIEACICLEKWNDFFAKVTLLQPVFGREVVGDPRFVFDLRNGRDPRPQTVAKVRAYLQGAVQ